MKQRTAEAKKLDINEWVFQEVCRAALGHPQNRLMTSVSLKRKLQPCQNVQSGWRGKSPS